MTGDPGTENRANKPPPTGRTQEKSKGDAMCPATSQNPSCWHSSWLSNTCTTRKDSESEWLARDNLETNPITIKPRLRVTWHSSPPGFPYPPALCPGTPFPVKSLALSACGLPRWWIEVKNPPANAGSIPGLGRSPEEGMETHSSILTWSILWTKEDGGLQSIGSKRVRYDWSVLAAYTCLLRKFISEC